MVTAVTEKSDGLTHSSIRGHKFLGMIGFRARGRTVVEVIYAAAR